MKNVKHLAKWQKCFRCSKKSRIFLEQQHLDSALVTKSVFWKNNVYSVHISFSLCRYILFLFYLCLPLAAAACTLKLDISSVRNWQKTGSQCVVVSASIYNYNIIFIIFLAVRQDPYSVSGWRLHSCWSHSSSLWCMIPVLCRKVTPSLTIVLRNVFSLTINIFRISRCRYWWNKWCRGWWWWQWWHWGWWGRWWWWWWNRWWWWRWWRRWTVKWRLYIRHHS